MDGTKHPIKSLGVIGPLVGLLAMLLNAFFGPGTVTEEETRVIVNEAGAVIYAGAALFTIITGVWGRLRANKRLSLAAPIVEKKEAA